MASISAMQQQSLIKTIEEYCASAGIEPSTLGVRALGNSRFFDRLKRKLGKIEEDGEKLLAYMAANPPEQEMPGEGPTPHADIDERVRQ